MTWDSLKTTGRGQLVLFARIRGLQYVFATDDYSPSDSWWYSGHHTVKPWLQWQGISVREESSFVDGTIKVEGIKLTITDSCGDLTSIIEGWRSASVTALTATLSATATSMSVDSTSDFPSVGYLWIGAECIKYSGKTATTFTGLSRGYYGTTASEHTVNTAATPTPQYPPVLSSPMFLGERRVDIYAGTVSGGTLSDTTCIFRGYVEGEIESGNGVWELSVQHISTRLSRKLLAHTPRRDILSGFYPYGGDYSDIVVWERDISTGAQKRASITLSYGSYYSSPTAFANAINSALRAAQGTAGFTRYGPFVTFDDDGKCKLVSEASTTHTLLTYIAPGTPYNALGFDAGSMHFSNDGNLVEYEADNKPAYVWLEYPTTFGDGSGDEPFVYVDNADGITASAHAFIGKQCWLRVSSVSGNKVAFVPGVAEEGSEPYLILKKRSDATLAQGYVFDESLVSAMKRTLHLVSGQTEPASWGIQGFESDDFSFSELETLLETIPAPFRYFRSALHQPEGWDRLFCDALGILGIAPRLTDDGAIGFAAMQSPISSLVSVTVDSDVWSYLEASGVVTTHEGASLINEVIIEQGFDWHSGKYGEGQGSASYYDGINALTKTRARAYKLRGVIVGGSHSSDPDTIADMVNQAYPRIAAVHFGVFGRAAARVALPVTWLGKQADVGDLVSVTHPTIVAGSVGISERVGIVVGATRAITSRESDVLDIIFPPSSDAGRIAPCALGTSWDATTKVLSFSDTAIFSSNDLSEFSVGDYVAFERWNSATSGSYSTARITAIGSGTVTLDSDPFSTFPTNGVLMFFVDYDDANVTSNQQEWLYLADSDYSLDGDDGYRWGL